MTPADSRDDRPPGPVTPALRRVIGVSGLTLLAINCVVGSGIFGLPGLAAALLGPAALFAYVIVAVLILLVGLCFAEVGSRVAGAGGLYAYSRVSFGPVVGGVAGTLIWAANSVVPSAAVANLLVDTLAAAAPELGGAAARAMILAGVYALFAFVNIRAAHHGARLSTVLCLIKLVPLAALVVGGLFVLHGANLRWAAMPATANVGQACVLVFFAFMGTEGALTASGEVLNPSRTVPRAVLLALSVIATLYIGLQLVAQGVLGGDLATAQAPLVSTATAIFGPWGGRMLVLAIVLSVVGFLAGDMVSSPRVFFALAEAGQMPRILAAVHPRFRTPAVAIVTYATLCAVVAWSGSFRELVIVGSSGTLMLYLICCLGLLRLRAMGVAMDGEPFHAPGGPFLPLAAAAIIVWMLTTLEWKELAAAFALVGLSGAVYWLQLRFRPVTPTR